MPQISVVIICYNYERYVGTAIESVLAQTFADFELLVVDDGSTDGSPATIQSYAARDPRVRHVRRDNGGLSAARNTGIRASVAPWVAFLDCDDWWLPQKLEAQLARAQETGASFVYTGAHMIDEASGRTFATLRPMYEGDLLDPLLINNVITGSASGAMVAREKLELVGGFDEGMKYVEDWDTWLRLAPHCTFAAVPEPYVCLLQRSGSWGSNAATIRDGTLKMLERAFATYARHREALRPAAMAQLHFMASLNYNRVRMGRDERRELARMLRYRPLAFSVYRRILRSFLPHR